MLTGMRQIFAPVSVGLCVIAAPDLSWSASSDRITTPALEAQLISREDGIAPGSVSISAGLAIDLAEGWKTYWRSPGEVGFPPEVDWSASQNVASVDFRWPAPERFAAFGIESFGYHDEVVFPLEVQLEQPAAPVRLVGAVTLLACSDICVPYDFTLTLDLPSGTGIDSPNSDRIERFDSRVPLGPRAAGIETMEAHMDAETKVMTVAITRDAPFEEPDLFPEFGSSGTFGVPDIRLGNGGHLLWAKIPIVSPGYDEDPILSLTVTDVDQFAVTMIPLIVGESLSPPKIQIERPDEPSPFRNLLVVTVLCGLILGSLLFIGRKT